MKHPLDMSHATNSDLGHLKRDIAAAGHDFCADLDQLFLQARQRPVFDRLRRRQRAQEIAENPSVSSLSRPRTLAPIGIARAPGSSSLAELRQSDRRWGS